MFGVCVYEVSVDKSKGKLMDNGLAVCKVRVFCLRTGS